MKVNVGFEVADDQGRVFAHVIRPYRGRDDAELVQHVGRVFEMGGELYLHLPRIIGARSDLRHFESEGWLVAVELFRPDEIDALRRRELELLDEGYTVSI